MRRIFTYALALVSLAGCTKDILVEPVGNGEPVDVVFNVNVTEMGDATTKSWYFPETGSDSFDDEKITELVVAAYESGVLHTAVQVDGTSPIQLRLNSGSTYNLYALANMNLSRNDILTNYVSQEALLGYVYSIPSFGDVSSRGIPMSGSIEGYTVGGSGNTTNFSLKRLFAKVTINANMNFDGGTDQGIKVTRIDIHNANKLLSVFGTSKIVNESDRLQQEDYALNFSPSGSAVFYVPENMQGNIGSASNNYNKSPDKNTTINQKQNLLTYVDVTVEANSASYQGTIHYKSFLGDNATRNFDIAGNTAYIWTLEFFENSLSQTSWKVDKGQLSDNRYILFHENPIWVEANEQVRWAQLQQWGILDTNIPIENLTATYRNISSGSSFYTQTEGGFNVNSNASRNKSMEATLKPTANQTISGSTIFTTATMDLQATGNPRDGVIPRHDYYIDVSYKVRTESNVQVYGKGGLEIEPNVYWTYTLPEGLPHTSTESTNLLNYSYNQLTDRITFTPTRYAPAGDYDIYLNTRSGLHQIHKILTILDTRWINCNGCHPGFDFDLKKPRSEILSGNNIWEVYFAAGDESIVDMEKYTYGGYLPSEMTDSSPNAFMYQGRPIDNWRDYIDYEYTFDGSLSGQLSDYITDITDPDSPDNCLRFRLSNQCDNEKFRVTFYWKDKPSTL